MSGLDERRALLGAPAGGGRLKDILDLSAAGALRPLTGAMAAEFQPVRALPDDAPTTDPTEPKETDEMQEPGNMHGTCNMNGRIIDANLNRLGEGLRVIEDVCRFGLDDAALAGQLKAFRHDVQRLRRAFPGDLLAARDSIGDPGRIEIKEPARRADLLAVLGASFGRVAESLRVLEELGKLVPLKEGKESGASPAAQAKALRYWTYELEKRIVPRLDRRARAGRLGGLYLILTDPPAGYEALAEAAVKAGVTALQLRDKTLESGPLLALARRLRAITRDSATLFIVNDRPDIARLAEADGVHLGQHDLTVTEARQIAGDRLLVGKSTHNLKELRAALVEGPDYVGIGPVFPTTSKANPDPVLGLDKAAKMLAATQAAGLPAVAIGGLTGDTLPPLLQAGFPAYAMIAFVTHAANPAAAIRQLQKIEKENARPSPA